MIYIPFIKMHSPIIYSILHACLYISFIQFDHHDFICNCNQICIMLHLDNHSTLLLILLDCMEWCNYCIQWWWLYCIVIGVVVYGSTLHVPSSFIIVLPLSTKTNHSHQLNLVTLHSVAISIYLSIYLLLIDWLYIHDHIIWLLVKMLMVLIQ